MVPLTPFGSFSKPTTAPSRPQDGAKAFLVEEYKYLAYFVIGMAAVLALIFSLDTEDGDGGTKGVRIAAAFIIGAVLSAPPRSGLARSLAFSEEKRGASEAGLT